MILEQRTVPIVEISDDGEITDGMSEGSVEYLPNQDELVEIVENHTELSLLQQA